MRKRSARRPGTTRSRDWPGRTVALTALSIVLAAAPSVASSDERDPRWRRTFDASIGAASDRGTAAVSWNQLYALWPARLEVGLGARGMMFFANGPLSFRTGASGPPNHLLLEDAWVTSLNLQVLAIARLVGPIEAGFDLDLVGFSFGPRRSGQYEATDPQFAGRQAATVSHLDLFRGGIRDRGQLDSEFFVGVRLNPTWTLRAGLSHVVTGYRSVAPLDEGNRDFKRFTTQAFAGVSARLP